MWGGSRHGFRLDRRFSRRLGRLDILWITNTKGQSGGNDLEIQQDENLAVLYRVRRELRDAHNDVPIERSILNKGFELRRQHS